MRHILILFFCLFIGSLYGQIVRVDSTVIYESRSIYNQAGYYIGKDSFHVKQVRLAYCNDTFYERNDTLIQRFPQQFITSDSVDADITEVNVTNYLTGGGTSGAITIGVDTSGTIGLATKYDLTQVTGSGDITEVNVTNYLTGGGSSGAVTIGIDTSGTVGVATKYDVKDFQTGSQVRDSIGTIDSDHDGVADDADLLDGETGSYYLNRANHYGNQDTLTITGLGEFTEDRMASKIIAGSGISKSYNDSTGTLTLSSTATGSITEVSVTDYLSGGGTSGVVTIGIDTSGTIGVATKYDIKDMGDITEVTVTNYLTGGGTSGAVSIGIDTIGTVGVATKYDLKDFQTGAQVRDSIGILDANHDGIVDEAEDSGRLGGSNGSYYLSRANHTGTQDTSTITGLGEFVEDRTGAKIVAGTGITTSYNDATGETTINATGSGTGDITAVNVSGYLTGGGTSGDVTIGVDTTGTVGLATKYDLTTSGGGLSAEEVRDTVAAMFTTGSSITWNETDSADSIFLDVNLDPLETNVQKTLISNTIQFAVSAPGTTNLQTIGLSLSTTGTASQPTLNTTNGYTKRAKTEYLVNTPSTSAVAGVRANSGAFIGDEGYTTTVKWGVAIGTSNTSKRAFVGIRASNSAPTDVEPNTLVSCLGVGYDDANDSNIQFYHNDGSGTCTEVDLGSNFPIPTSDRTDYYTLIIKVPAGGSTVYYKLINESTGNVASGNVSSNIPTSTTFLGQFHYSSVGGVSASTGLGIFSIYGESYDQY